MTPLHWAARAGAGKCTRWLLARGADVNAETVSRRTALHLVAEWGLTDMIWLLAGHGADLNPQDTKGRTPLHRAAYMGRVEAAGGPHRARRRHPSGDAHGQDGARVGAFRLQVPEGLTAWLRTTPTCWPRWRAPSSCAKAAE